MNIRDLKKGRAYKFSPLNTSYDPTLSLKTVVVTIVSTPIFYDVEGLSVEVGTGLGEALHRQSGGGVEFLIHSKEWEEAGAGHSGDGNDPSAKGYWYIDTFGVGSKPGSFIPLEGIPLLEEYE